MTDLSKDPRAGANPQQVLENKLKATLMNFLYRMYLQKKSDDEVMAEIARKDLQRMSRQDWWALKQFFREREMSSPAAMAQIRRKIGMV